MKRASVGLVLCLVALVVTFQSNLFLMSLKLVVDSFAIGHSGAKVRLFLVYLALVAALYPLPSLWRPGWLRPFLGALGTLYALSLGEHLYYCHKLGLAAIPRTVCLSNGLQSATRLQHMHGSKAVLGILTRYTGQGFDAGNPFLGVFAHWWLGFHALLFLLTGAAGLALLHHHLKKHSLWNSLSMALVVFTLVKNSCDGGFLDTQTLAAVPVLGYHLGYSPRKAGVPVLLLLLLNLALSGPAYLGYDLWRFTSATACFSLPILCGLTIKERKWLLPCGVLALILPALPLLQFAGLVRSNRLPNTPDTFLYAFRPLRAGWTVNVVSDETLSPHSSQDFQVVEERTGRKVRVSRVKLNRDTTPLELCDAFSLNIFRRPVGWYQEPAYVTISGPAPLPAEKRWRSSPLVVAYLEEPSRLSLQLIPGAGTNAAADAFGDTLYGASELTLFYQNPFPQGPWSRLP